jgi:hypothetical protein
MVRMGWSIRVDGWGWVEDKRRVNGGWVDKDGWCVRLEGLKGTPFFKTLCEVCVVRRTVFG